jgi:Fur family transcriptional regulator, peroxide stress response regulator
MILIRNKLIEKGLKVTPQRLVIMDAIHTLNNHPTADQIIHFIRTNHPNISTGTVYRVIDDMVRCGLLKKVKTDFDIMRYDQVLENHHHLYCTASERIEDYYDEELTELLDAYFTKKEIPGFNIEDIKLQIIGRFDNAHTDQTDNNPL